MITITRTKRQATPQRKPLSLRSTIRKGLATIDAALEPKALTPGQELDAMLNNPDIDQRAALEAAVAMIEVELREMDDA